MASPRRELVLTATMILIMASAATSISVLRVVVVGRHKFHQGPARSLTTLFLIPVSSAECVAVLPCRTGVYHSTICDSGLTSSSQTSQISFSMNSLVSYAPLNLPPSRDPQDRKSLESSNYTPDTPQYPPHLSNSVSQFQSDHRTDTGNGRSAGSSRKSCLRSRFHRRCRALLVAALVASVSLVALVKFSGVRRRTHWRSLGRLMKTKARRRIRLGGWCGWRWTLWLSTSCDYQGK